MVATHHSSQAAILHNLEVIHQHRGDTQLVLIHLLAVFQIQINNRDTLAIRSLADILQQQEVILHSRVVIPRSRVAIHHSKVVIHPKQVAIHHRVVMHPKQAIHSRDIQVSLLLAVLIHNQLLGERLHPVQFLIKLSSVREQ